MPEYRIYTLIDGGHINTPAKVISHPDDTSAIAHAEKLLDGHDIELWAGSRLVIRLEVGTKDKVPEINLPVNPVSQQATLDYRPPCPKCGAESFLIGEKPHAIILGGVTQTFACTRCGEDHRRTVNIDGETIG